MAETTLNPAGLNPICSTWQWFNTWDEVHDFTWGMFGGSEVGVQFVDGDIAIKRLLMRFSTAGYPFPPGGSVRFEIKANNTIGGLSLTPANMMVCRCPASAVYYHPDPGAEGLLLADNYHVPTQAHGAVAIGTMNGNPAPGSIWSVEIPAELYQEVDGYYIGAVEKAHDWDDITSGNATLQGRFTLPKLVITEAAGGKITLLGVGR